MTDRDEDVDYSDQDAWDASAFGEGAGCALMIAAFFGGLALLAYMAVMASR